MSWRSGVYKIANVKTGDCYIGSAANVSGRWSKHKSDLIKNKHTNNNLQTAYNKYGFDCFICTMLMYCEPFEAIRYEQFYIDYINPTYNICRVAGSTLGLTTSEKQKQSARLKKGVARPDYVKEKIRKTMLGVKHTAERCMNMGLARKNVPWTQARRDAQNRRVKPLVG